MSFDIDVTLQRGKRRIALCHRTQARIVALIGPSGIGKTSILNMVAGLLRPDHGHVRVSEAPLFDSDRRLDLSPARRRLGYVFQDRRLFPHMRVRDNLLYGRKPSSPLSLDDLAHFLGIAHLLDRWPNTLSGGEAQRVAIGRALLSYPRALLMDEPLSSVDSRRKEEILDMIRHIPDISQVPILYVTHDLGEARRLEAEVVIVG
ncbi:ATP-binding cassette domain-containing protein [Sphingobium cloacae]|uniref:Molybdenum ABC transporter ATP-binding protein n=1 Tax=Sphingobium cloacae TaxID=120107 RepID=A0A1E1F5R2_9SPHN|nr:ATP-binding cassette domain-containing protein [Sphingobium cloacae]BAV65863.1 molybdenum ABC transporter ATP-binding protein [Sphingobium cloacae]